MPTKKSTATFSDVELEAMKETARERKAAKSGKVDGLADLQAKIAEMEEPDRSMATRVHELVMAAAPHLQPRTWYGMPAWARDGKVICFYQSAAKFKVRYSTLGFQPDAMLDDGEMWPTAWALTSLTAEGERQVSELVRRAAG